MPDVPLRLSIDDIDDHATAVVGEIDAHSAPVLAHHYEVLPAGDGDFSIDLSGVEFMDSSGLRVLIELHQRAEAASRRLVLKQPSTAVSRLLEISGLTGHLHID